MEGTTPNGRPAHADAGRPRAGSDRPDPPVLDPSRSALARRVAARLGDRHPATVFVTALLAGYAALAAVAVGFGLLLVHAILPEGGIGRRDEDVNDWLASHRTHFLNDATFFGSSVGDVPAIPGLIILSALVLLALRRYRVAAFVVGAILVELGTYRVASLLVHRQRPTVARLDHLPVQQSYPSGHVAASVVVYVGLALLATSWLERRWVTVVACTLAVLLPVVVAISRMYRGMHHPTDVGSGALVGAGSLLVALLAARACGAALAARRPAKGAP